MLSVIHPAAPRMARFFQQSFAEILEVTGRVAGAPRSRDAAWRAGRCGGASAPQSGAERQRADNGQLRTRADLGGLARGKRPAVVVGSDAYHQSQPDLRF